MKCYKLVSQKYETNLHAIPIKWEIGKAVKAKGLVTDHIFVHNSWIECCDEPLVGLFLNVDCWRIPAPRILVVDGEGSGISLWNYKRLFREVTPISEVLNVTPPNPTQQMAFAILCTKRVCTHQRWNEWADNWLSGVDRSPVDASELLELKSNPKCFKHDQLLFAVSGTIQVASSVYLSRPDSPTFYYMATSVVGNAIRANYPENFDLIFVKDVEGTQHRNIDLISCAYEALEVK